MNQLRRKFASLWRREEDREDGNDHRQLNVGNNGQNLSRRSSASSAEVPAALEIDAAAAAAIDAGAASPPLRRRQDQQHVDAESKEEAGEEEEPSPPRLLSLAYPWGTSDARPPPGWKSSCSSQPISQEQRRSHNISRSEIPRASGRGETAAAAGGHLSWHVDLLRVPAPSPAIAAAAASGGDGGRRRRGSEEGVEDEEGEGRRDCGYRRGSSHRNLSYRGGNNVSASKRQRAAEEEEQRLLAADGRRGGGDGDGGDDGEQRQHAARRRRTCPADSTFVSPTAKRSVSYCTSASATGAGGAAAGIAAVGLEDHDEELRRSSTPSRLIFRAGFFKALRGSRAAAKRARSATKLKRKTRELQAAIARREFHQAHPPHEEGPEEDDSGGGGGAKSKEGERTSSRGRKVGGTLGGAWEFVCLLRDQGDAAASMRRRCG